MELRQPLTSGAARIVIEALLALRYPLGPLQQQVFQLLTTRVAPHQLAALSDAQRVCCAFYGRVGAPQ